MKEFLKIYKNQILVIITSVSLTGAFVSCCAKNTNSNENVQIQIINNSEIGVNNQNLYDEDIDVNNQEINDEDTDIIEEESKQMDADSFTSEYIRKLKDESNEESKDDSKLSVKLKDLVDFAFNGKKIGDYTFDDLTDEGKENVMNSLYELDTIIDKYVPNYKDRIKKWFSEKEDTLVDAGAYVMDKWENYKDKVQEKRLSKRM